MIEVSSVDENWLELNNGFTDTAIRAAISGRKQVQNYSRLIGEEVLYQVHIRNLAFLLRFRESDHKEDPRMPFISKEMFKDVIEKQIPEKAKVDLHPLGFNKKEPYRFVYRRSGVEFAFAQLSAKKRLDYTPQRFQQALDKPYY